MSAQNEPLAATLERRSVTVKSIARYLRPIDAFNPTVLLRKHELYALQQLCALLVGPLLVSPRHINFGIERTEVPFTKLMALLEAAILGHAPLYFFPRQWLALLTVISIARNVNLAPFTASFNRNEKKHIVSQREVYVLAAALIQQA